MSTERGYDGGIVNRLPPLATPRCRLAWAAVVAFVAVAVAVPEPASARRPKRAELVQAETYAQLAKEKFRAKQYQEAAELFMRVYRLSKKQTAVFNAARCKEMGGRLAEAKGLFELYLSIADSEDGKADARAALVRIAEQVETRRKADLEAARRAADARRQAEETARKAEQAREQAELRAKKLEQDKKRRARLVGVCVLPPTGVQGGDMALAAARVVKLAELEARRAAVGPVRGVAAYNRAESQRGVVGNCDLSCKLSVARGIGARWAIGTSVQQVRGRLRVRSVLWRTLDMGQDGTIEVDRVESAAFVRAYQATIGDLFNAVRGLPVAVDPAPAATPTGAGPGNVAHITIVTRPAGATLWLDARKVGVTPRREAVKPGWHRVQLKLAGHRKRGGLFYVRNARAGRVSVVLPKLLKPPAAAVRPGPGVGPTARPVAAEPAGAHPAGAKGVGAKGVGAKGVGAKPAPGQPLAGKPGAAPAGRPVTPGAAAAKPTKHGPSGAHPPAAGSTGPRARLQPGARPRARKPATSPPAGGRPATGDRAVTIKSRGVGWLWSISGHFTGGIGVYDARTEAETGGADLLTAGGLSFQFGYATRTAPHVPWFYVAAGLKYGQYQGNLSGATTLTAPSAWTLWTGLGLPRMWGLRMSVQRHLLSNSLPGLTDTLHGMTSIGVGKAMSLSWFMIYVGMEFRLNSDRPIGLDVYGEGPKTLLMLELGFNAGGVRLSR